MQTDQLVLRVPTEMKEDLELLARVRGQTVTSVVLAALEHSLEDRISAAERRAMGILRRSDADRGGAADG